MRDFLDLLAITAKRSLESGYYKVNVKTQKREKLSLKRSVWECNRAAVISEIKFSSPSSGVLRSKGNVRLISSEMAEAGVIGISILTEPKHFSGSLKALIEARKSVNIPLLMKDIIVSRRQIDAAYELGADAVLLIEGLFERGYTDVNLHEMIKYSHKRDLEVLLETHSVKEFRKALLTDADLIGINNRDLRTLKVNIKTTKKILEKFTRAEIGDRPIVSESGIKTPSNIRFLRSCGADAFLVGSTIMAASKIRETTAWLVNAYEKS